MAIYFQPRTVMAEFPVTSAVLHAAAFSIGAACKQVNDQYMQCRHDNPHNPNACHREGQLVEDCVRQVFETIHAGPCARLFDSFWKCLDMNNQDFIYCRGEEAPWNQCVREHYGWKKELWVGLRLEDGFRPEGQEMPAHDTWQYRWHVWKNKAYHK